MKSNIKKFCKFCNRKFGATYNFCPVCGKTLETIHKINYLKLFEPYLKGTGFSIVESKDGERYLFEMYRGNRIESDTKKIIKRFIKNKPDFLTPQVFVYNSLENLTFNISFILKEEGIFSSSLNLPVSKSNTDLILCLIDKENIDKIINRCQDELDFQKECLKDTIAKVKRYESLKKQLSKEE